MKVKVQYITNETIILENVTEEDINFLRDTTTEEFVERMGLPSKGVLTIWNTDIIYN